MPTSQTARKRVNRAETEAARRLLVKTNPSNNGKKNRPSRLFRRPPKRSFTGIVGGGGDGEDEEDSDLDLLTGGSGKNGTRGMTEVLKQHFYGKLSARESDASKFVPEKIDREMFVLARERAQVGVDPLRNKTLIFFN